MGTPKLPFLSGLFRLANYSDLTLIWQYIYIYIRFINMFTTWFASFPTSNREHALLIQFAIMELFWGITIISFLRGLSRWWFQIFVYFHPYVGKIFTLVISIAGTCTTSQIPRFHCRKIHLFRITSRCSNSWWYTYCCVHIKLLLLLLYYTIHTVHMFAIILYTF